MHLVKIVVFMGVYFLPSLLSLIWEGGVRKSVFLINLFLGWTLIGWFVALKKAHDNKKLHIL